MSAKQESQSGYNILFSLSLPQGQFFDMAKKDLAEEDASLSKPRWTLQSDHPAMGKYLLLELRSYRTRRGVQGLDAFRRSSRSRFKSVNKSVPPE